MARGDRPTMVDVAADAGVSLKTVSRVINGVESVDADMAERVRASIAKLGFRRNAMAANLRAGSSDIIGLVTADLANTFYTTIASAVAAVANARGLQVMMASSDEDPAREKQLALDLCLRRVAGLIVVPAASDQSYLQAEVDAGIPVVFLDRPGRGARGDVVLVDNRGGAFSAVAELIQGGHRRIAVLLDSLEIYTMAERHRGVVDALRSAGIAIDPALVSTDAHAPEPAARALRRMLDAPDPPTAVFCGNNRATVGAIEAILAVGADIAVTGFDDFELSRLLPRPIRIVDYDTAGLGTIAAETLLRRIDGQDGETTAYLLPTHLVDRGRPAR